jgi:hypothetical protein
MLVVELWECFVILCRFVGVRSLLSTEVSQRNHADVKQVKKQHQFPGTFS